eukprot:TRINITY_DN7642_c0_g2_i1.p1 TRINITY_DN7642_c0_g2~~TRINITY_DN7642_c0_g2_i1.p1  ORF type:complete len:134 (-),score=30.74 TRINITY_DN7642_c0_g2_i1:63-416(-)
MANKIRYVLLALSLVLMLHAAYSTVQHRTYLKLVEKPYERVPTDILVEGVVAVVISIIAIALFPTSPLKPIKITTHIATTTLDQRESKTDFAVFSHRGSNFLSLQPQGSQKGRPHRD